MLGVIGRFVFNTEKPYSHTLVYYLMHFSTLRLEESAKGVSSTAKEQHSLQSFTAISS